MATATWERRNARARALGYENYYDYRAHGYGSEPPSAPRATGEELARLRGHRADADLARKLESGQAADVSVLKTVRDPRTGQITELEVMVTDHSGRMSRYRVRDTSDAGRQRIDEALLAGGVEPKGYLKRLLEEDEEEDLDYDEDEDEEWEDVAIPW